MLAKPLAALTAADIQALVGLSESRTLEFKRELVGGRDEDKREFLADVSSLANAQGGDLVFGIAESKGVATAAPGVDSADPDAEMQRLEGIIRDGLEPRLPVELRWVEHDASVGFLVVRARASFAAPHRVRFRDHAKFYGRNSGGKYPMDVHELRAAFAAGAGLEAQLEAIHARTVNAVVSESLPVEIATGPFVALNYVPLGALFSRFNLEPDALHALVPTDSVSPEYYPTLDGLFMYCLESEDRAYTISITHRAGYTTSLFQTALDGDRAGIYAGYLESRILGTVRGASMVLGALGLQGTAAVCVSLVRVSGHSLHPGSLYFRRKRLAMKGSIVGLPPLVIDEPTPEALLPLCRLLWNAFGLSRPEGREVGAEA